MFEYIGKRGLLESSNKHWAIINGDIGSWVSEGANYNIDYRDELPFLDSFKQPDEAWLDWHNDIAPYHDADDVPVEWGNKQELHWEEFYARIERQCKKDGNACKKGRDTDELFLQIGDLAEEGTLIAFTYCQSRYYDEDYDNGYIPNLGANCNNVSRQAD